MDHASCQPGISVATHRIGMAVAEVKGNQDRNTDNPLSGSPITRKEAAANIEDTTDAFTKS